MPETLATLETLPELARRWKVKPSWLYGKTRERGPDAIPRIRIGKYIRFLPHQADAWLIRQQNRE